MKVLEKSNMYHLKSKQISKNKKVPDPKNDPGHSGTFALWVQENVYLVSPFL